MKQLARLMAKLYPPEWRRRYGREFSTLLSDVHISWSDLLDIAFSAFRIRIDTMPTPKIVSLVSRDIPHGTELESTVELPGNNDSTILVRDFFRELDFGDTYVTLRHWSRGDGPAQTILIVGKKGEIESDFRTDETEMLVLQPDGTVRRTEQTVKTSLKYETIRNRLRNKYRAGMKAGLTPDEIYRQIVAATPADSQFG